MGLSEKEVPKPASEPPNPSAFLWPAAAPHCRRFRQFDDGKTIRTFTVPGLTKSAALEDLALPEPLSRPLQAFQRALIQPLPSAGHALT
jgi:hypothetical protein